MTNRLYPYDTSTGRWWLPDRPGDIIAAEMVAGKIYDPAVVGEAYRHIVTGTHVLELGANFGQMAVLFAKAKSGVFVHAFEAQPFVVDILQRNVIANAVNVQVYNAAVWYRSGCNLTFPTPHFQRFATWGSYGIDPQTNYGRTVTSLAIDDVFLPEPISFMKIDVQGADLFAMQGARQTIAQHQMPIVFEFEAQCQDKFGTCWDDYERFIAEIGYAVSKNIDGSNYLIMPPAK